MSELVSAICCTHGRLHVLNEVVQAFLDQDYHNKELIIVNDHVGYPLELAEPYPGVRVYNYEQRFPSLGAKRNIAKGLANGKYICIWEDDDLSTPWRISSSVKFLEEHSEYDAVKSCSAIHTRDNVPVAVSLNNFEGSACFRSSFLKSIDYDDKRSVTMDLDLESRTRIRAIDSGPLYWYVYRWGLGVWHLSGRGADDSEDNWNMGAVHARTDLGTIIKAGYRENYWTSITELLKDKLYPEHYKLWCEKMVDHL